MGTLELKVPPLGVALVVGLAMWLAAQAVPPVGLAPAARSAITAGLVAAGLGFILAGILTFRRAKTTVNPTKPGSASSLVRSGVYRVTRNPMYLGMLLLLLGWAARLSNVLALAVVPLFVIYMNRFQIGPEERALSSLFGAEFDAYRARVRRWI